ncbi:HET-domain-containing protein [Lophium mytilinum]|uniref:HET-domain-containing protein n=1 Tax=Lophium mytilinum TaxID=390894 RepID=A0A6A6QVA2_9PEZI|nr:HET-domain-containing protein [Lophium mytilinum]
MNHRENSIEAIEGEATGDVELDDEDFLFESSPSSTLEDRLLKSFVASTFDSQRQSYLPEGRIVELVTAESITEELELDHLDPSTAAKFDQSRQAELVDWILNGARKLFAICVECGILPRRNMLATFLRFRKYGFDDKSLPIRNPRDNSRPTASNSPDPVFHEQVWSMFKLHNFYEKQWKYLVPVFGSNQYDYDLPSDCILPFQTDRDDTGQGAFSSVYKVKVHPDHMRLENSEKETPRQFLERRIIKEVIVQLRGIADALDRLHNFRGAKAHQGDTPSTQVPSIQVVDPDEMAQDEDGYFESTEPIESIRHGDLKPENILRFPSSTSTIGELRIADMGLAKRHNVETELRTRLSSTRYGTMLYEAPEVVTLDQARSRLYDIWSMGCITLEFIIWMLYGNDELKNFHKHLQGDKYQTSQFFEIRNIDGRKHAAVHSVVRYWIDYIRNTDPECSQNSAMNDLLSIVQENLLVVSFPPRRAGSMSSAQPLSDANLGEKSTRYRATAREFRESLDRILEKVSKDPTYLLTGKSRKKLADWEFPVDNEFATGVFRTWGLHIPHDPHFKAPTKLCQRCNVLNFWAGGFDLEDRIADLEARASDCDFCRMLRSICAKHEADHFPKVRFERSQSNLVLVSPKPVIALSILRSYGKCLQSLTNAGQELETPLPIQLGLPELLAAGSDGSFDIMRAWLDDCDTNHENCQPDRGPYQTSSYPTRLIDVGHSKSPKLRLVVPRTDFQPFDQDNGGAREEQWIALSHSWGNPAKQNMFWTGKDNIESFRRDIPFEQLPATFRDAVITTRALHVRYLWIDAICILNGPDGDYHEEAKRMEDVFSGAHCVIAASRATSQADGFLKPRPQREYVKFQRGSEKPFYMCDPVDNFNQDVLEGPLNRRGWILQERALARRTIFFTDTQTYFECGNGVRCETLVKMHNNMADFLGDPHFPNKAMSRPRSMMILHVQDLFRQYSRLAFSHNADRPVAIAGIENRLKKALGVGGNYGVFDDGPGGGLFHRGLLWQRGEDEESLTPIHFTDGGNWRVPTWSWMAYDGGIDYLDPPFDSAEWETTDVRPPKRFGDFAGFEDGAIMLPAIVRDFSVARRGIDEVKLVYDTDKRDGIDRQRPQCVVVAKSKTEMTAREKTYYVLIVVPSSALHGFPSETMYVRVGVGRMLGKYIALGQPGIPSIIS